MDDIEKVLKEIKVWEAEVVSEKISGNIVKLAYAKGRLNGLQIVYAFERKKIKKLEGWLKYLWGRYGEGILQNEIEQEIDSYIETMEGK